MKNGPDRISKEMAYAARMFSLGMRERFRPIKSNRRQKGEEALY